MAIVDRRPPNTEKFVVNHTTGQIQAVYNSTVGTNYPTTLHNGYLCRAWVNFNGTGTPAIRASGNVSSITKNGTGDYTVNFTTAMPDANYATIMTCRATNTDSNGLIIQGARSGSTYSTTAVRVLVSLELASSTGMFDADAVYVSILR